MEITGPHKGNSNYWRGRSQQTAMTLTVMSTGSAASYLRKGARGFPCVRGRGSLHN